MEALALSPPASVHLLSYRIGDCGVRYGPLDPLASPGTSHLGRNRGLGRFLELSFCWSVFRMADEQIAWLGNRSSAVFTMAHAGSSAHCRDGTERSLALICPVDERNLNPWITSNPLKQFRRESK